MNGILNLKYKKVYYSSQPLTANKLCHLTQETANLNNAREKTWLQYYFMYNKGIFKNIYFLNFHIDYRTKPSKKMYFL